MDRQYIRDMQVIERYLQGKLAPAEEEAFEEAYLADAELLEDVKAAERLREGLQDLEESRHAPPLPQRGGWREVVGSPRYGMAASVVAALALLSAGTLYVQDGPADRGFGAPRVAASHTRLLPLVTVRGSDSPNVIDAPAPDEWIVLLLDSGFTDYDRYSATLVRLGGDDAPLLRVDDMTPTYDGMLALGMPGRTLAPGEYEVRLEGGQVEWPADRPLDELSRTPLSVE